jgi:hypothetical protein
MQKGKPKKRGACDPRWREKKELASVTFKIGQQLATTGFHWPASSLKQHQTQLRSSFHTFDEVVHGAAIKT